MGGGHLCQLKNLAMRKRKMAGCVRLVFVWLLANGAGRDGTSVKHRGDKKFKPKIAEYAYFATYCNLRQKSISTVLNSNVLKVQC